MRMRRMTQSAICLYNIFPRFPQEGGGGGEVIEHKMSVSILYTTFLWNISQSKKNPVRYSDTSANEWRATGFFG